MRFLAGFMMSGFMGFAALSLLPLSAALAESSTSSSQQQASADDVKTFSARHLWDARVEIGDVAELGASKYGARRMIPITGGTFSGARISGTVLSGGADFQLTRADGDTEFLARYMLKTQDGFVIQVTNRALSHTANNGQKDSKNYFRSVIDLEAPADSPYAYLNHAIYLGTLNVPQWKPGEKPYVIIGVYELL